MGVLRAAAATREDPFACHDWQAGHILLEFKRQITVKYTENLKHLHIVVIPISISRGIVNPCLSLSSIVI